MRIKIDIQEVKTRDQLESYIRSTFGDNPAVNANITLELSQEEAQTLSLDASTKIYGVRCEVKE